MGAIQKDSIVKNVLKSLCCTNGWSYGVFWRFDQRNSLLLTVQDFYCEEKVGGLIDDLLLQVHMLGGGVIGQAAFTKKHRWMLSDAFYRGQDLLNSSQFQDDSGIHRQFSSGVKTIAVISVEPQGVVQFGSTEKILERAEFVNQTKKFFQEIENGGFISSENAPSSSNSQNGGPSGLFASLLSSELSCFTDLRSAQGIMSHESKRPTASLTFPTQSFSINSNLQISDSKSQAMSFNQSATQFEQQPLLQFHGPANFAQNPCDSSWSRGSTLTSDKQPQFELRDLDSWNTFSAKPNSPLPCSSNTVQNVHGSTFTSLHGSDIVMMQDFMIPEDFFQNGDLVDFSPWFDPSPDQGNFTLATSLNDDLLSQAMGLTPRNIPVNQSNISLESSMTNNLNSNGKGKCADTSGIENDVFGITEMDFGCGQAGDWGGDMLMPGTNDNQLGVHSYNSECISDQHVKCPTLDPRKGLFSRLGIEELLDGISGTSTTVSASCLEDQVSSISKRRRTGSSLWDTSSLQSAYNSLGPKKEVISKSEPAVWVGDGYSMNASGSTISQAKKHVEPLKATKKKAKPGARPRPKDRQQILDRMAELRELIPNGEKMSIDCLLDRTIKHMLFLQSVTKHADRLKQVDKPKDNAVVQKDYCSSSSGNGVTWACEYGNQTMICPLIVEDLSTPGQMLIEMLCEEQGFFLEIVDIIRGFGLTILKGVMEVREDKIWARFIVEAEANKHVTRHEIFSALVQLLQATAPSDQLHKVIDSGTSLLNNYQHSVPLPVSLADTLHCINL